jgi:hypothetical protein
MEVNAAKKIHGQKVLLTKDAFVDEENADEHRERADEIIALNYDIK